MKKIVGFLLITLTIIISACHSQPSYDSRLLLADSIMQHRPDSALALLRNVNASDLSSEADVALHALLLSQAYDKNYIDLTNDSLISIAVDYFSEGNEPRYAMLAHYYLGRVFENSGKIHKAIIECTKAQQYSDQTNDYLAVGLIYTHLGYNYNNYYDFEKTIEYYLLAAKYYELAQKHYYKLYALSEVASAYINNLEYSKAYDILQQVITEATDSCNHEMIETGNKYMITLYSATKKYAQVYDLYQSIISNNPNFKFGSSTYMSIALACAHIQRENEINTFIDKAWNVSKDKADTILIHFNTAYIYQRSKQYERAYKNLRAGINKQDSSIRAMLTQPILTAQRDLYLKELELTKIQKQNAKLVNSILIVILISGIILITLYYFYTRNKHRAQAEKSKRIIANSQNLAQQIELLSAKLSSQEHELHTEKSITDTLKKEITATKTLLQSLKLQHETKLENQDRIRTAITSSKEIQQVRSLIDNNQPIAPDFWIGIESLILTYYPQFKDTLLEICSLNEKEYKLCILLKAEFTPTEISKILCSSKENVSSMRRRLYTKFFKKAGKPKDFDDFIVKL